MTTMLRHCNETGTLLFYDCYTQIERLYTNGLLDHPCELGILLLSHTDDLLTHPYDITAACLCHTDELISRQ